MDLANNGNPTAIEYGTWNPMRPLTPGHPTRPPDPIPARISKGETKCVALAWPWHLHLQAARKLNYSRETLYYLGIALVLLHGDVT